MLTPLTLCFTGAMPGRQIGMTLIEVLVAMLILSIGLLGAVVVQLNALKYTDSSRMTSQASFIAYDILDRIRANSGADYTWHPEARTSVSSASVRDMDLRDFETNIRGFAGESAKGSVSISASEVTVSINWDDLRGTDVSGARQTLTLTSRIGNEPGLAQ